MYGVVLHIVNVLFFVGLIYNCAYLCLRWVAIILW